METTETLLIERTFRAPAQAVFDAWTDEDVLRRWFHAGRDWETSEASVDVRVGGTVRLVMRDPSDGATHGASGRYTEVDPPRRLAFTWIWDRDRDGDGLESLIEIDFEDLGDGSTAVSFTHSGLRDEPTARDHERGWGLCFDNLDRTLARGR
ncbi:MAG: SRPBCC domain-containing protein [Actinobacteria bacterium]|nr:SRPBCC domain-containing protein [Actinomycetota bacterium]